ncbi:MAG: ABC transporter ATP-binding protein [Candidatus Magasanikbacteria bacterium]|jgi:ATP-binding cassette subfamily B protein
MKNNTRLTLAIYWRHVRSYLRWWLFLIFCTIAGSVLSVIVPIYIKKFFDAITDTAPSAAIATVLIGILLTILLIELLEWVFWRISTFLMTYIDSGVSRDLYRTCFNYLHRHSYGFFNNNFVGSLVKRTNRFVGSYEGISDRFIWNFIPLVVNLCLIIVILSSKNISLGLILIGWIVFFMIFSYFFSTYKLKYDVERSAAETEVSGVLADTVTNHINLKLFNGYAREVDGFEKVTDKARRLGLFTWNLNNIFEAIQGLLAIGLEIGVFYMGILMWKKGIFTVGDFVLLQSYTLMVFMKIWDFGRMIRHVYRFLSDAEEMTEILNTPHEIVDKPKAKDLKVSRAQIKFDNVLFGYNPTRAVLSKFNFVVAPQEKVALVGPSGAGKSTIVKLILRLHEVGKGKILIDDQSIAGVKLESLWRAISWVPQDPILFHRTLLENIRYGRFDATDEEVYEAAQMAHCHEFISEFPDGYKTFVGERGMKLSGGERQRVAIARAILRNAPILIMDEATSSLDSESEKLIQDALTNLMKNKTVITVAHRLSTIMKMDRIVVIGNGGIVEQGTHAQLLKEKNGLYQKLWSIQAGGFIA